MDNIKNDNYYTKRILKSVETLTRYLKDKSLDDVLEDGFLRDAIENRFTKIVEDTSHLTKEFKVIHSEIPWGAITKIRNTVCHDYDVVDASSLFRTVKTDFPVFRKNLLNTIKCHYMSLYPDSFNLIETLQKMKFSKRPKIVVNTVVSSNTVYDYLHDNRIHRDNPAH